jgi:hypothetical protein|tara:strand:+ start:3080 stop:5209 length:2130 start_codon:yes stop_codon:yes gene_type:complete
MNKSYLGNVLGIVLQNDDPEHRGRIKIYIPHISVTVYKHWHEDKIDKHFKFPDMETNPDLSNIMEPLKDVLPWAESASPLFGGDASGRYNATTNKGTTSDSNVFEDGKLVDGNRPIQNFIGDNVYEDRFSKSNDDTPNKFTNQYAHQYTPSNYSNLARGMFTIPNVGSHVWVFFAGGDPNLPVYFAASHGKEDWERIYTMDQKEEAIYSSPDYPGAYENITASEDASDSDSKTFRAKTVFNSNKHSIELVDTDNREILKMTHFSGSFKEFCNHANIELATNNDQKMVVGDQFYTVQKNQSIYVGKTQDIIVVGDRHKTIGPKNYESAEAVLGILRSIHEFKRLFDGRRANQDAPAEVSAAQTRSGIFKKCPVCNMRPYSAKEWTIQPINFPSEPPLQAELDLGNYSSYIGKIGYWLGSPCDVCNPKNKGTNRGFSPSTQDGMWIPEPLKAPGGYLDLLITTQYPSLMNLQKDLGEGDEISTIAKNKVENIGLVVNDLKSFRVDPIGKLRIDGVNVALEGVYPTFKPSPHVEYVDVDDVPGGDYNLTCGNKYKLLVGAKGINIKTFGPMDMYGTIINLVGEQVNISSQNEVLIDGGERFSIRARKISLIPIEHQPVVVDGQMHVTRNAVIAGGMFVEGEVGMLHMTTPYEFYTTEPQTGTTVSLPNDPTTSGVEPHSHVIPPHTHIYKHSAVTFLPSREAVRDSIRTQGG